MKHKPKDYYESIKYIEEIVKDELEEFSKYNAGMKMMRLTSGINRYIECNNAANTYKGKEKKNPQKWKHARETSEYLEALASCRVRMGIQSLSREELEFYVRMLELKQKDALLEKDMKKRLKKYDFIIAGCQLCKVDFDDIMERIELIKLGCSQIISDIPSM